MAGHVGRFKSFAAECKRLLEGPQTCHRGRHEAGLRLPGVVEQLLGTLPGNARGRPAERGIRLVEGDPRAGRGLGHGSTHADRLGSLWGEEERHAHSAGSISISSCPYSTASPVSLTRCRTVPPRGARTSWWTPSISTWPSSSPFPPARPGPSPSA